MNSKTWICHGCPDPCTLISREDDGRPTKCVYGLSSRNFRWDEEDRKTEKFIIPESIQKKLTMDDLVEIAHVNGFEVDIDFKEKKKL